MTVSVLVVADKHPVSVSCPLENCNVTPDIYVLLNRKHDIEANCFQVGPNQNIDVSVKYYPV